MTKERSRTSLDAVKRVIAAFERSDWSEIDVRVGDVRLHLSTGAVVPPTSVPPPPARVDVADPEEAATADAAPPHAPPADGVHVVTAPSPGIFWRSPEPGAPPFADIGDVIESSATVCIVEVMKLMNHVKAGIDGVVVAVYGENGVAVQKGDPLFGVAPIDGATPE